MLWNRFTGINAQKEVEVMIKKPIKPELIQYALNYLWIKKRTCLLNIPWLLIDANLFYQFFWLTSKQDFKNSMAFTAMEFEIAKIDKLINAHKSNSD